MNQPVGFTHRFAELLVFLCRQGRFVEAQKQFYADDALGLQPASLLFAPPISKHTLSFAKASA